MIRTANQASRSRFSMSCRRNGIYIFIISIYLTIIKVCIRNVHQYIYSAELNGKRNRDRRIFSTWICKYQLISSCCQIFCPTDLFINCIYCNSFYFLIISIRYCNLCICKRLCSCICGFCCIHFRSSYCNIVILFNRYIFLILKSDLNNSLIGIYSKTG